MSKKNILSDIIFRKYNQLKNKKKLEINTSNKIVENQYVNIGGIEQWISIRGEDFNNPALLFIHGGPASTYTIFSPLLRSWEKYFTIVHWDQRGAGKTFGKNKERGSGLISFKRLAQDGIEVTDYICKRLGHPKIILIGSSLGSLISTIMIKERPDLFFAYVGTDQNAPDPKFISYQLQLNTLKEVGDTKGVQLIEKMGPDFSKWSRKDYDELNKHIIKSIDKVPNMIMDLIFPYMISSPDHKIRDLINIFKGMDYSLNYLFDELRTFDIREVGMKFDLPFFVFQGDTDILTPTETAKAYFNEIDAPHKEFVLIKQAGHLACFARPNQFLEELNKRVMPWCNTN
ncbi:alpha/beta fold hydrolase [Thermoactinomyces mirandus]|uniref:Alpha/beta hydrolase n=1 Tax=Thermoactinomyces mirandus TaxID=2756294 RepID=A0A7W1XRR0_9BACL|nr:alpha/beta hydrolase [Thermoactinomyces mirandus]MBA4601996.1 alpha/beta hydrolase [Thermoactinomyces mirandus]